MNLAAFFHTIRKFSHTLSMRDMETLARVLPAGSTRLMTVGDLAESMGIHASNVVRSVDALEDKRLVIRSAHKKDRRRVSVRRTARGERLVQALEAFADDEEASAAEIQSQREEEFAEVAESVADL